jgi:uncharacterized protein with GYD domain
VPRYLILASLEKSGAAGIEKEGGSRRRDAVTTLVESLGGRLEAFYFMFGEADVVSIVDLPANASAASLSLAVAATGIGNVSTTVLLTPEEIDDAVKMRPAYRPPGEIAPLTESSERGS